VEHWCKLRMTFVVYLWLRKLETQILLYFHIFTDCWSSKIVFIQVNVLSLFMRIHSYENVRMTSCELMHYQCAGHTPSKVDMQCHLWFVVIYGMLISCCLWQLCELCSQTPLIRFVVDLLYNISTCCGFVADLLWTSCTTFQLVVDLLWIFDFPLSGYWFDL